eukprot:1115021-Pyramimonas_sp.AAC.1
MPCAWQALASGARSSWRAPRSPRRLRPTSLRPARKKKAKNNLNRLGVVTSGAEGMQNLKLYWVLRHQDDGDGALERIDKAKMDAAGAKLKRTARLLRTYYIVQRSRKPTLNSELPRDVFVDPAQFPDFPKNVRPDSIWLVDSCVSKTQLGPGVPLGPAERRP